MLSGAFSLEVDPAASTEAPPPPPPPRSSLAPTTDHMGDAAPTVVRPSMNYRQSEANDFSTTAARLSYVEVKERSQV